MRRRTAFNGICKGCEGPCGSWEDYCYTCRDRANEARVLSRGQASAAPQTPCIYVVSVESRDDAPVKFGYSVNPKSRLGNLQIGSPVKLEIIASCIGPRRLEQKIHIALSDVRLHGEWFARSPLAAKIVEHIAGQRGQELFFWLTAQKRLNQQLARANRFGI